MAHYEQALRQVRYRNWQPANLSERRFRLTCSELNGRYTSNEFNLEVGLMFKHPHLPNGFVPFFWFIKIGFFCSSYIRFSSIVFLICTSQPSSLSSAQVSVLHHSAPVEHVNHMAVQPQYMRPVHHPLMIHTLNSHMPGKPQIQEEGSFDQKSDDQHLKNI